MPFGSLLWVDFWRGNAFVPLFQTLTGIRKLLGGGFFAFMRLLRNFKWYDFASIFVYGKV